MINQEEEQKRKQVAYFPTELSKEANRFRNNLIENIKMPYFSKGRIIGGKLEKEDVIKKAKNKLSKEELDAIYAEYSMTYDQIAESVTDYNIKPPEGPKEIPDEQLFEKKLQELIVLDASYGNCISQTQFEKTVNKWPGKNSRPIEEWYSIYNNGVHSSPGWFLNTHHNSKDISYTVYKSPNKRAKLAERLGLELSYQDILDEFDETEEISSYFPLEENKKYYLHKVWKPNTYLIDLMQSGKFIYLIAINVNTRYAYAEVMNQSFSVNEGETRYGTDRLKATPEFLSCLSKMMNNNVPMIVKYLTGDSEKSFGSETAKNFYSEHKIKWIPTKRLKKGTYHRFYYDDPNQSASVRRNMNHTDPLHSSLGIIDRFIRTLRDMAYNSKIAIIEPNDMDVLVELYNNAPHKTLSYYAGRQTTPKEVQLKPELEMWIMRRICQENFNVKKRDGFHININEPVKVYNEKDVLQKEEH